MPDTLHETEPVNSLSIKAREKYFACMEDASKISETVSLFQTLPEGTLRRGQVKVYLGALEVLRGKQSFFPVNRHKHIVKGLKLMDRGLQMIPEDIESLFVHGSTCNRLPFYYRRRDDAQRDFKTIIQLLPDQFRTVDRDVILRTIDYIINYGKPDTLEKITLIIIENQLFNTSDESGG